MSDISDSGGESRVISISKGRKGRRCRRIVFEDFVYDIRIDRRSTFLPRIIMKYTWACLARTRLHTIPYVRFECESDIFVKHVLIQVLYLR